MTMTSLSRRLIFIGLSFLASGAAWSAETIVQHRLAELTSIHRPQKVTVGPDDQFQGVTDPERNFLIFTRKADMVTYLCKQDLKNGKVTPLFGLQGDSQEPQLSPQRNLAFTYYKFNARGDICYLPYEALSDKSEKPEDKIKCLKSDQSERSSPFWKSESELGFLSRNLETGQSQIIIENLNSHQQATIAQGMIWSPSMRTGSDRIFYNASTAVQGDEQSGGRGLFTKKIGEKEGVAIQFDLPGLSGFPVVSADDTYLYFSQFLNDTNGDGIIDAGDNSVLFRAELATAIKGQRLFPEQLTSAEYNCSIPRLSGADIFATCAFEGTLDVYSFPQSGLVPSQWTAHVLANAHQTARTPAERILLLNVAKFRNLTSKQLDSSSFQERVLSNHLFSDDIAASQFYLEKLKLETKGAIGANPAFTEFLKLFLEAKAKKKAQPAEQDVSPSFRREILDLEKQISGRTANAKDETVVRAKAIFRGLLKTFIDDTRSSAEFLKAIEFKKPAHPLEWHYYFELAQSTYARANDFEAISAVYQKLFDTADLTAESKLYYGLKYLTTLGEIKKTESNGSLAPTIDYRIQTLQSMLINRSGPIISLFQSEAIVLRMIRENDENKKSEIYKELDQILSKSRSDYFLRKAIYVRAILIFAEANDFKYLDFIATNWIRYTEKSDTEFAQARTIFAQTSLDRGYDAFAQNKLDFAGNFFYGSLTLNDDLESHEGYINTLMKKSARDVIDERYTNLRNRKYIDDNFKLVEAFLGLIDEKQTTPDDTKTLDASILKLEAMTQDKDSPVRYLLLGYCFLEKLIRTQAGYEYNQTLLDQAHHNLMLAYDLGRDNARIKAAALTNLGMLHHRVSNHGLAAKFFTLRKPLGFVDTNELLRFTWVFAKSLFFNNQPDLAAAEISAFLTAEGKRIDIKQRAPFLERLAFYYQASEKYEKATLAYGELESTKLISGDLNLAKNHLGYGFSLLKTKQLQQAKTHLKLAIDTASRLTKIEKSKDRVIEFEPIRIKLNACGLLAQIGPVADQVQALTERLHLLETARELKLYDDTLALMILARLQGASLLAIQKDKLGSQWLNEGLKLAEQLVGGDQALSHSVFKAITTAIEQDLKYHVAKDNTREALLKSLIAKTIEAYSKQAKSQPFLALQKLKLQILWVAYQHQILHESGIGKAQIEEFLKQSPDHAKEVEPLAKALMEQFS